MDGMFAGAGPAKEPAPERMMPGARGGVEAGQGAHQSLPDQEGNHGDPPGRGVLVFVGPTLPFLVVRNDQGLLGFRHLTHCPLSNGHPGTGRVAPDVVTGNDDQLTGVLLCDGQLSSRHPQKVHRPFQHPLEELGKLQLPREILHGIQERLLFLRPPLLGPEASVQEGAFAQSLPRPQSEA